MPPRVLIIEHSSNQPRISELLAAGGPFACETANWDTFLLERLDLHRVHLLLPVAVPAISPAMALLDWLRQHSAPVPTLAIFPSESEPSVLRTVSELADDFMLWPPHRGELGQRVRRMLGTVRAVDVDSVVIRLTREMGMSQLVGRDHSFLRILERIPVMARTEAPLLITGETGTGKEVCARAVHHLGSRSAYSFIPVDCGALPDHLFENEVFGHVRGAYTDARSDQKGLAGMADKGTLFLDEVDALSLPAQAKLLRFLQDRTYKPLGSDSFIRADVNVIAASNRDLESLVAARAFRADLFFRLNVLRLHLPPLRERRNDIGLLAEHFLQTVSRQLGRRNVSAAALRKLCAHDWPGNVRELFNVLHRAALFAEGSTILPSHITFSGASASDSDLDVTFRQARAGAIEIFERTYVENMLRKHNGNVTHAAREARQDRRAFGRLVKKYGIVRTEP